MKIAERASLFCSLAWSGVTIVRHLPLAGWLAWIMYPLLCVSLWEVFKYFMDAAKVYDAARAAVARGTGGGK